MFRNKKLKDVDSASRAQNLHAFGYAAYGGVIFGFLGFAKFGPIGFFPGWIFGAAVIYGVTTLAAGLLGGGAASLYMSSGSSTPAKREYSHGDALNAHGKYEEAVAEYERCAVVYPEDPEPRLRLARMLRDRMQRYEDAATAFRQAMAIEGVDSGVWIQTARELAELYTHRIKQPERALPVLAQLSSRFPATPAGQWAKAQVAEIKQSMNARS